MRKHSSLSERVDPGQIIRGVELVNPFEGMVGP